MKSLIIYGTRSGATKGIAEEIGAVLSEQGFAATVLDAKRSRGVDVNAYDLIVVGSSVWATFWKWEAKRFIKRNQKKLAGKKVALFSSGLAGNDPEHKDEAEKSIAKQASKFPGIKPLALAYFGGMVNFDNPPLLARPFSMAMKKDLEKKGIDTSKAYDMRDLEAVRRWASEVVTKARA